MDVKRYDVDTVTRYLSGFRDNYCDGGFEDCKEDPNGYLVAYEDYCKIRKQLEAADEQLKQIYQIIYDNRESK